MVQQYSTWLHCCIELTAYGRDFSCLQMQTAAVGTTAAATALAAVTAATLTAMMMLARAAADAAEAAAGRTASPRRWQHQQAVHASIVGGSAVQRWTTNSYMSSYLASQRLMGMMGCLESRMMMTMNQILMKSTRTRCV